MNVVRCPSASAVKIEAVRGGLDAVWPGQNFEIQGLPVELQDRADLQINAEPEGLEQTINYARARWQEMCKQHGVTPWLDISIESGAIEGFDVAVIALFTSIGKEAIAISEGVPIPNGTLEEARRRGFKTTTAGDIIHERWPHIPANSWQEHFPPYLSRQQQIQDAIIDGLRSLKLR